MKVGARHPLPDDRNAATQRPARPSRHAGGRNPPPHPPSRAGPGPPSPVVPARPDRRGTPGCGHAGPRPRPAERQAPAKTEPGQARRKGQGPQGRSRRHWRAADRLARLAAVDLSPQRLVAKGSVRGAGDRRAGRRPGCDAVAVHRRRAAVYQLGRRAAIRRSASRGALERDVSRAVGPGAGRGRPQPRDDPVGTPRTWCRIRPATGSWSGKPKPAGGRSAAAAELKLPDEATAADAARASLKTGQPSSVGFRSGTPLVPGTLGSRTRRRRPRTWPRHRE